MGGGQNTGWVCVRVCLSVCLSVHLSVCPWEKTLCCEKSYPVSESYPVKKFSCEKSYPVRKSYSVRKRYPVKSYLVRKELSSKKKWEKLEKSKKWKGVMACDVFACDNLFVIPNTCRHLTNVTRLFLLLLFVGMYLVLQTNCVKIGGCMCVCVCVCFLLHLFCNTEYIQTHKKCNKILIALVMCLYI